MMIQLSVRYSTWGFPYRAEVKEKSVNYGYFDYKRNPEQISNIPEVKDWPEMEDFIRAINASNSFFRTLGCDVGYTNAQGEGIINLKSYVDIAFEILEINFNKYNYYLIFDRLNDYLRHYSVPNSVSAEFTIQYTVFNDHKVEGKEDQKKMGWSLVLRLHGVGRTIEEARAAWGAGLQFFKEAFTEISMGNADELNKGRQTIS